MKLIKLLNEQADKEISKYNLSSEILDRAINLISNQGTILGGSNHYKLQICCE